MRTKAVGLALPALPALPRDHHGARHPVLLKTMFVLYVAKLMTLRTWELVSLVLFCCLYGEIRSPTSGDRGESLPMESTDQRHLFQTGQDTKMTPALPTTHQGEGSHENKGTRCQAIHNARCLRDRRHRHARLVWTDGNTPSTVSKGKVSIGCCDELHEEANAIRTSLIGQNQFTITDLRTHGDFSDRTPGTRPICKASHAVILL
jgi:hypothetical protein